MVTSLVLVSFAYAMLPPGKKKPPEAVL